SSDRVYLAAGVQGLAPYWFETDLNLRVDADGKITADGEVELDLLFTQRLILQPRAEFLASFSNIEDVGIYRGLNSVELGLRLRYEIRREFAPYAGVSWTQLFGESADAVRESGEKAGTFGIVIGIRMWL
ncbi:MAG TPA: copper resistance protein B, partial [Aquifex aeolicus]|nr:copper resistance protein B [Aquifex aeolicus]